jgi:peptidoglycan/LPS O-acetylase OafA/YrhL
MNDVSVLTRTEDTVSPDRTSGGKAHFEVLDGLRGSAAFLVVAFHIIGIPLGFNNSRNLLHHAYLAVDFFFGLSGFVIGYAYDDRWSRMTMLQFFKLRLIRLHSLVILGATMGLASYLFDPYGKHLQQTPLFTLLLAYLASVLLIPSPSVQNRIGETHTLNSPSWSLTQEYLANIAYALVLRRLRTRVLAIIAVLGGLILLWEALQRGSLDAGWGYRNFWMAPIRLTFPFVTGLWLYRVHDRLPRIRLGFLPLTVALLAAFMMPVLPKFGSFSSNGLYDALCVLLIFPAILVAGSHSDAGRGLMGLCRVSGRLSYPLYMTHYPFMYVYANWVETTHPARALQIQVALLLTPSVIFFSWLAVKFFDEPIRAKLRRYSVQKGTLHLTK